MRGTPFSFGKAFVQGRACAVLLVLGLALASGCAPDDDIIRLGDAELLYDGEPYGDFLVLADAVRECMGSKNTELPNVRLVDRQVECRTKHGWKWVLGCEGVGGVVMVAPVLTETKGMLWSHELTHYYGDDHEGELCGALYMDGFTLEPHAEGTAGAGGDPDPLAEP